MRIYPYRGPPTKRSPAPFLRPPSHARVLPDIHLPDTAGPHHRRPSVCRLYHHFSAVPRSRRVAVSEKRDRRRCPCREFRRDGDGDARGGESNLTMRVCRLTCFQREGSQNVFSYLQIRGSSTLLFFRRRTRWADLMAVPLFWTQTGYGLKPPPVLAADHTPAQNIDAMKRHFQRTLTRYGPHVSVAAFHTRLASADEA